ncbi:Mitochondrial distribution and morphology protein 12, partial [Elasticomyces elasticus]
MTREFEKERQRERERRAARGRDSRAYPLASSKPIVEVYKNVREAVEEREPSGEGEVPRMPADESSRTSDEFGKNALGEGSRQEGLSPKQPTGKSKGPAGSAEADENARADDTIMSDGEPEEAQSDEDRASADGLQMVDSQEELPKMSPEDEQIDPMELKNHERSTLLKLLTNFWSERSASGWAPLEYPLTMYDHVFADCDIIVREDEPSSLVAFALDSRDYKEKLSSIQHHHEDEEPGFGLDSESRIENSLEKALLRNTGTHLKYEFQEGQAKMLCKVFYAEQFDALRQKCGIADRVVESLSRCAKWDSKGGKTKSIFLKTLDNRFILKSLAPIETQAFLKFAPGYFQIMSEALFHELPSAIAKMFGFYQ